MREIAETGKLPVPNFSAGGVATPADAALMMQLGAEAVFVGSGIFKSGAEFDDGTADGRARQRAAQAQMAEAIVKAVTHFEDPTCSRRSPGTCPANRCAGGLPPRCSPAEQLAARGN